MKPEEFNSDRAGKVLKAPAGYWTFVPRPLPPELTLGRMLVSKLSRADRSLGLLAGIGQSLPRPDLVIGVFVRREAVLSCRIEGIRASTSDLCLFEATTGVSPQAGGVREVASYVSAVRRGLDSKRPPPISLRLIRELHRELTRGVRAGNVTSGEFRTSQNWIGPVGCSLEQAILVPPAPPEMKVSLDAFEKYLHEPCDLPPLIRLALVHYQFEVIHPFVDGNGRIGRLLNSLLLCEEHLLPSPLLCLSAFFEPRREEYHHRLLAVSRDGDWEGWVAYFLDGVEEQATDAERRVARLTNLREKYLKRVHKARSSALLIKLVDALFELPAITVTGAAKLLGITHRAATLNIRKLVDVSVLAETTGRARYRVFMAREIIKLIEQDLPADSGEKES